MKAIFFTLGFKNKHNKNLQTNQQKFKLIEPEIQYMFNLKYNINKKIITFSTK